MNKPFKIEAYGNYNVLVDQNLSAFKAFLKSTNYSKYFVLVDENTKTHCLPILQNEIKDIDLNIIEIKCGEQYKNFETLQHIIQQLISQQADRKALLINLGGGVICDMGAFAASIYKRGIDFIQMPTTLLAMVDASVGGKTGINFNSFKNQVGTFANPQLVYANIIFLKTLKERHLKNGYAEMLKHGYLSGNRLNIEDTINILALNDALSTLIFNSVQFKNKIVTADFGEKADRKQLNFGHTIGHAIESYSLKNDGADALLHGEAIAIGFIVEAIISTKKYGLDNTLVSQIAVDITQIIFSFKLTVAMYKPLFELMKNDKKNNAGTIQFALLKDFGAPVWDVAVTEKEINDAFEAYYKIGLNGV